MNEYDFDSTLNYLEKMDDRTRDESNTYVKLALLNELIDVLDYCKESIIEDYEDENLEKYKELDWYKIYSKLIDITENIDKTIAVGEQEQNARIQVFSMLVYSIPLYEEEELNFDKASLLDRIVENTADEIENPEKKDKEEIQKLIYNLAEAYTTIKEFDKGEKYINKVNNDVTKDELILYFIEILSLSENLEKAIEITNKYLDKSKYPYYQGYKDIITSYFSKGYEDKSKELVNILINEAKQIKDEKNRNESLEFVVKTLAYIKMYDKAIELASTTSNKIKSLFENGIKDNAYLSIISQMSNNNKIEQAKKLLSKIKNNEIISTAKLNITTGLTTEKRYDEAVKYADTIKMPFQKEFALKSIVAIMEKDNFDKEKIQQIRDKYKNYEL